MVDFDKGREQRLKWFEQTGGAANGGLTVRDYFAAKAMASYIGKIPLDTHVDDDGLVANAYSLADAMMKERGKPAQQPAPTVEEAFGL